MISLRDATAMHQLAEQWSADRILVEHDLVERFSRLTSTVIRKLGTDASEDEWASVLRPLRRLRWRLATVPAAINDPAIGAAAIATAVIPELQLGAQIAPGLAGPMAELGELLEELETCEDNPLGTAVADLGPEDTLDTSPEGEHPAITSPVSLLVADGGVARAVRSLYGPTWNIRTSAEMMAGKPVDKTVVVGPASWYPAALLRAPRSRRFEFVYFAWLADRDPDLGLLTGSERAPRNGFRQPPPAPDPASGREDPSSWIPRIEWSAMSNAARGAGGEGHGEPAEARLFALASGEAVYLEWADGSQAHVAELEDELSVHQVPVTELEEGRFVVLRTSGEGDYVREIADRILGDEAPGLRAIQREWKEKLAAAVAVRGISGVIDDLKENGSQIASEQNLRRWMSESSLKTQRPEDFGAIMQLIGEEARTEEIWAAMEKLHGAHMRAGNQVRQRLLDEIARSESTELLRTGWADYDAEEIEGEGALRVARIVGIGPEVEEVPRGKLRKLARVSEDAWHG
jgi:hypothetical protein